MNLSLYKLRKKLNTDKSGQGSLVAVILASVIGTIIISSTTQWFLSMNKTMDRTDDRLEAMSIAMSEWQRLEHMSLNELEANRENYKTPYNVGDKFTVGVNLGEQGFFDNGTCNALTGNYASESPNCFQDTTMTVYDKDGKAMYTTRSLPLSSQNAYVLNDSSLEHKISQKYDNNGDVIVSYVDGVEKAPPIVVPDYENSYTFYILKPYQNLGNWSVTQILEAPSDGYIIVRDCFTRADYFLQININVMNLDRVVYHKCAGDLSGYGMFNIRKGDKLYLIYNTFWTDSNIVSTSEGSRFIFCPAKRTLE